MKLLNVPFTALITYSSGQFLMNPVKPMAPKPQEIPGFSGPEAPEVPQGLDKFRKHGLVNDKRKASSDDTLGWPCRRNLQK